MATIVDNVNQIQSWVRAKQTNEQELLKRLNRVFNRPLPYDRVRKVVTSALLAMRLEANENPGPAQGALNDESRLAVWQKIPTQDIYPLNRLGDMLADLICRPTRFDSNDLSELIRVIGAWLENGGGHGGIPKELTEAFRPGLKKPGLTHEQAKRLIWDKRTVRQREDRIKDEAMYHAIEEHVRKSWVRPRAGRASGLQMFRVNRDDLCRKIDLLFGLLKGATISGTTTDTVLVLEVFGYEHGLHAGYYLFPVATIAASLHHTLVEAGLALSLVGAVEDYHVGYYSTLVPKGGLPGELGDVNGLLDSAEKDMRNRKFILWYAGSETPAGCVLFSGLETQAFRNVVRGKALLDDVRNISQFPSKREVARLLSTHANELYRTLPVHFKKAAYEG